MRSEQAPRSRHLRQTTALFNSGPSSSLGKPLSPKLRFAGPPRRVAPRHRALLISHQTKQSFADRRAPKMELWSELEETGVSVMLEETGVSVIIVSLV